jgi:hypothetical protein
MSVFVPLLGVKRTSAPLPITSGFFAKTLESLAVKRINSPPNTDKDYARCGDPRVMVSSTMPWSPYFRGANFDLSVSPLSRARCTRASKAILRICEQDRLRCRMLAEGKRNQSIFARHPLRETPLSFVAMLFFGTMFWLHRMSSGPQDGGVDVPAH